jgi:hypothetical protein
MACTEKEIKQEGEKESVKGVDVNTRDNNNTFSNADGEHGTSDVEEAIKLIGFGITVGGRSCK